MKTEVLLSGIFITLLTIILNVHAVLAHESITVGDYEIIVGWSNEPPIAGQQNAIAVNVMNMSTGEEQPVEDISSLTVTISYGGQSKILALRPLGEDTPGQFIAPILPTIAGEYEVIFGGSLGDTAVDAETHVEEVEPANTLAFPSMEAAQTSGGTDWLVWLSLLIGLIGLGVGTTALRKASMR